MPIVYLTTNLINNKKYIGVDSKNDPKYLGSGKWLKRSINKYGIESFTKEVLKEFETEEQAYLYEIEMILKFNAVESNEYYNIQEGGNGGWSHVDTAGENNPMYGKSVRDVFIQKHGELEGNKLYDESRKRAGFKTSLKLKGVKKTKEHKKALSKAKLDFHINETEEEKIARRQYTSEFMQAANIVRSDEYKAKMSESMKAVSDKIHERVECEYCGRKMNKGNLKRWHGEKCKRK